MTMRIRHSLYLDRAESDTLAMLASRPGGSKSAIVNEALRVWFSSRASKSVDDVLKVRLDRINRMLAQNRRDLEVLLESLSLFIRYELTINPPVPDADDIAHAVGRDRFEAFVTQVGRQLALGDRTLDRDTGKEASE